MLTAAEVAAKLGISPRAVYDIPERRLPRYRFGAGGGAVRFAPEDVEAYRASCRSIATSAPDGGASTSTTTSTGNAFGGANFSRPGGPEPKPKRSTARKARPYPRSRTASPSLGAPLTKLSLVT